jgi:PBP1b-binding outer membrane lipoprotein LpoB
MKIVLALVLAVLVTTVLISGCTQQPSGQSGAGKLTQKQAEGQAFQAVQQEVDQALGNITLQEVQNELLQQG